MFTNRSRITQVSLIASLLALAGCAAPAYYDTTTTTYTPQGTVEASSTDIGGQVISLLKRQFQDTKYTGVGEFTHANKGLARRAATQLAVAELAGKVETEVQGNSQIFNNQDIRDVVETRVHALVKNFDISNDSFDAQSNTYTIEVEITGEKIVEEFQRQLR